MSDPQNYLEAEQWEEYEALPEATKALCVTLVKTAHGAGFNLAISRITNATMQAKFEYQESRDV